jgi:hypothetical protein
MNTIDPLVYAKRLTAAGVPAQQAQVHAEFIREVLQSIAIDRLEGKVDTGLAALNTKIDRVKAELEAKIDGVKAELEAKIDGVKAELEGKIERTKADLERKIDQQKWSLIKWMFALYAVQGTTIISAVKWLG